MEEESNYTGITVTISMDDGSSIDFPNADRWVIGTGPNSLTIFEGEDKVAEFASGTYHHVFFTDSIKEV